jgi:hypothetical protein
MATKRFASLAADEIEKRKMLINAKETMKGNQKEARTLKAYLKEAGQDENYEEFDVAKRNEVLRHFYMNARKQDSDHYKATSLKNIRHALSRHLQSVPYNRKMDIIKETDMQSFQRWGKGIVRVEGRLIHYVLK